GSDWAKVAPAYEQYFHHDFAQIECSDGSPYEVAVKAPHHILTFVSEPTSTEFRIDSDKLVERYCVPYSLAFYPAGSDCYFRRQHQAKEGVNIIFKKDFARTVFDELGLTTEALRVLFRVKTPGTELLAKQFLELFKGESIASPEVVRAQCVMALSEVAKSISNKGADEFDGLAVKTDKGVFAAIAYIEQHCSEELDLNTLARQANMSASGLTRAFKNKTGLTPWAFILKKRLEIAETLVLTTNKSLVDIAIETGFCNQAHFTTAFKREHGTTPGQARMISKR
ncbi:MAG: AraC family transcriptional regulator, partial [Pseudomonadota bacterium]